MTSTYRKCLQKINHLSKSEINAVMAILHENGEFTNQYEEELELKYGFEICNALMFVCLEDYEDEIKENNSLQDERKYSDPNAEHRLTAYDYGLTS